MRSDTLTDLETARKRRRIVSIWRRRVDDHALRGVVMKVGSGIVLLHLLDEGIRLDGYSIIRLTDITKVEVPAPRSTFYHEALRIRGQRAQTPRAIVLSDLGAAITSAGRRFPLVTVHPERKDKGICWIGKPLVIARGVLVLSYIDPGAVWDGEQRCRLRDITKVDFGGAYETALAEVAKARARVARR